MGEESLYQKYKTTRDKNFFFGKGTWWPYETSAVLSLRYKDRREMRDERPRGYEFQRFREYRELPELYVSNAIYIDVYCAAYICMKRVLRCRIPRGRGPFLDGFGAGLGSFRNQSLLHTAIGLITLIFLSKKICRISDCKCIQSPKNIFFRFLRHWESIF